ncbi:hypothetical protein GCM10025794_15600 [Massilia kyonggiensis]
MVAGRGPGAVLEAAPRRRVAVGEFLHGAVRVGQVAQRQHDRLRILRERLQALYGSRAGFVLRRGDAGLTEAVLTLPAAYAVELAA